MPKCFVPFQLYLISLFCPNIFSGIQVHETFNYGLDIRFFSLFYEYNFYAYFTFGCKTSK